jgi:hypothetical protein
LLKRTFLYLFCLLFISGFGQSRKRNFKQRELGFFGGASYYIGDINPRGHFRASHPAGGIFFRYTTNYRYAFRFGFNYGKISGNDAKSGEADQVERNLNFQTNIYDAHAIAEFNFVDYRIGHDKYRFTMFLFAGLGGFYFSPQSSGGELRDQRSEGQAKAYPKFQLSLPFGIGLKWNVGDRCGLGIEWGPRHTFTDYLDDIKGVYSNVPVAGAEVENTGTNAPGNMRGNPSTKDWYFFYGVTLNIKLRDPHRTCHGMIIGK